MSSAEQKPPFPDLDEQRAIIEDARAGVPEQADRLMRFLEADLLKHIRYRMGSKLGRFNSPEDLAQEAFARSIRALSSLREGAVFEDYKALLLQHANWVLSDMGRQAQGMDGESVAHLSSNAGAPPPKLDPSSKEPPSSGPVTARDLQAWLGKKLSGLDPKYATVLKLYTESLPFDEIARRLGISQDAARKRFQRGLEMLRLSQQATKDSDEEKP